MTPPTSFTALKPGDVIQEGNCYVLFGSRMRETQRIGAVVMDGEEYFRPAKETKPDLVQQNTNQKAE